MCTQSHMLPCSYSSIPLLLLQLLPSAAPTAASLRCNRRPLFAHTTSVATDDLCLLTAPPLQQTTSVLLNSCARNFDQISPNTTDALCLLTAPSLGCCEISIHTYTHLIGLYEHHLWCSCPLSYATLVYRDITCDVHAHRHTPYTQQTVTRTHPRAVGYFTH